ncbi:MarR family transcriptional regulator [Paenibacillus sp. PR3]|uniref:MarR family transcriptional regulator n=1 Tax=Paenibacillus terricola TaxID=2763503 RepID=A0ABR8MWI9_9BACL|nr:MarR family transcriptional regulator [Paenibacillus terricola]MBD3919357.1 MarR family transcriptional regulator [Paenibacillus terricola]
MDNNNEPITVWLSLSQLYSSISDKLEQALQQEYGLSLKEFSVLYFISNSEEKKLRLQSLQEMVGLSQSATSRLVVRMEAKECGALHRHMCTDDRRGIYTQITEIGESKFQHALQTFNQVLQSELQREGLQAEFQSIIQKLF